MPTDADFLAAIAAAPHDRLPRLVYADWLDERNDPRGELIRLEEETRERVAWDDVLWKLKPRRNELRRQTDADWLKAMDYGQHCEPLFRGQPFPTDVRDAWRLIREAHERWTGEPMPDVGGHQDKVAEAEKRLGLTLPASVREYVAFAHDFPQREQFPPGYVNVYRDWLSLEIVRVQPALSVIRLWEGDVHWAVRFAEFQQDDPPVYTYRWAEDETGQHEGGVFLPEEGDTYPTLSQFVFGYGYLYCVRGGSPTGEMSVRVDDVESTRRDLQRDLPFCTTINGLVHHETTNYSAVMTAPGYHSAGEVRVCTYRPVTEAGMPACIREWFRAGAGCNGVFGDLRYGYVNGRPPTPPPPPERAATELLPPEGEWPWGDDIPF